MATTVVGRQCAFKWVRRQQQNTFEHLIKTCLSQQVRSFSKEDPNISQQHLSIGLQCDDTFKYSDLTCTLATEGQLRTKPNASELRFGEVFTDHMLKIHYNRHKGGWQHPFIIPFENITLHPAAKVFHYAIELFEGLKCYRGVDGKIRIFRPQLNMQRMNLSARCSGLPTFNGDELARCLYRLIQIEQDWVPHCTKASLYIRPTLIGTDGALGVAESHNALLFTILCPVGSYYKGKKEGISLLADPSHTRAWPGGCGNRKMGANYGPTIRVHKAAIEKGLQGVLWLYGHNDQITEAGTMNIFIFYTNENGSKVLATPPLNGLILPGVIRQSILELTKEWGEFQVEERTVTMKELLHLHRNGRYMVIAERSTGPQARFLELRIRNRLNVLFSD